MMMMMMIAITIPLILFCSVRNSFGTMLPLEVIEITQQQSAQVYNTSSPSLDSVGSSPSWNNSHHLNRNSSKSNSGSSISISGNGISSSRSSSRIISSNSNSDSSNTNDFKHKSIYNHHSERRRSRQMLEMLQPQGTRILYQVGDSENDLPVCAPNAVCSKIDLYETPWIERQCRCPDSVTSSGKGQIIIHHKDHQIYDTKYKNYFDAERTLQHKRLQNFDDNRLENMHLKKLMHKLDAVFQDDIMLDESEFRSNDEVDSPYHNQRNDFPAGKLKEIHVRTLHDGKLRHAGHRKDFPHIGGCPSSLGVEDGHTIADKTRHYKLCNPVHKLPICRYFRDYTWTLSSSPELNVTEQIVHCRCPKNSITYLTKREPLSSGRPGYTYLFACSPQSRLRCQRKEPCKLFTVRKRQEFLDEVNTNPLCQCPKGYRCPKHHTDPGVIAGKTFIEDNIQTYSGYCMAND